MNIVSKPRIAVMIPCYNEQATVGKVVDDFREQLPEASIYVYDNNSTDNTATIARQHGAIVIPEPRQGKGYVIESMFGDVDADVCVMVDGDDTYPADCVHKLLEPVIKGQADMAVGARLAEYTEKSFRPLHVAGNHLVRHLINRIFNADLHDILSGYRAFNRKFITNVPVVSQGFEVETELTIQMLYYRLKVVEVVVPYRERPAGSVSKLNTFSDGFRVLWKLFNLFRTFKPLTFFGTLCLVFFFMAVLAGLPPVVGYIQSGFTEVRRFPLAILATGLMLMSCGFAFLGLILNAINWRFRELHNIIVRRRV
ncbi:MAG TPA: glycosyltransferase [Phycisphaerae bacterium]|nr:glycosyltransferase [Phycisphaerae bacterium]